MALFEIQEARREASPVFMAFVGQSGSGKTLSALMFARGLVGPAGKIGVVDTEGKRALIYADDPQVGGFFHADFVAPYSSRRFREALREMIAAGMDAVIFDSASHEHEAEGGMLDFKDQEAARGVKQRGVWIKPKMEHGRFITACRGAPIHVIFCIREKVVIDIEKQPAEKLYLPVCDRDLPFEFMLTIRLEPETHRATFLKVPKPYLAHIEQGQVITVDHGRLLMAEAGKGERVDGNGARTLADLEAAADESPDALRNAYLKAWRDAGPSEDKVALQKITPMRALLQKHTEGLKLRSEKAEQRRVTDAAEASQRGDDPPPPEYEPGDIGSIRPAVEPNFDNLDSGDALFRER
jgi:hypothetical protein